MLASLKWRSVDRPEDVVVDIGGGNDQISEYLARHTSNTRFITQDLSHVGSEAPEQFPGDLKDRLDFVVHDFFSP